MGHNYIVHNYIDTITIWAPTTRPYANTTSGPLALWSACSSRLPGGCRLMGVWVDSPKMCRNLGQL